METLRGLWHELRMMGAEIYGPLYIYGNIMYVIQNTQRLESTLNNKFISIFCHVVKELVAIM